jgi:hypothetical protein
MLENILGKGHCLFYSSSGAVTPSAYKMNFLGVLLYFHHVHSKSKIFVPSKVLLHSDGCRREMVALQNFGTRD